MQTEQYKRILVIEDDQDIADLLAIHLGDLNYDVEHCTEGKNGLDLAVGDNFDLVILDLMLPDIDGFDVCRKIRENKEYIPILMLTSRAEEIDRVLGLEIGADDYLTKPFSVRELQARVKAIFRRMTAVADSSKADTSPEKAKIDKLEVDFSKRKVCLQGEPIDLTVKEFDLLEIFMRHPGRAFSRKDLLNCVWGYQFNGYDHTVNSHINRLRAKIEDDPSRPKYIKTVWGLGYRFCEEEELEE
jgi:DNA-binding response OmpR family regulator